MLVTTTTTTLLIKPYPNHIFKKQKDVTPNTSQAGLYSPNPCARIRLRQKEIRRLEEVKAKVSALEGKQNISKIDNTGSIDIGGVTSLKYQAFRPRLIVGTRLGTVHVWNTDSQKIINTFPVAAAAPRSGMDRTSSSAPSSSFRNAIRKAWIVNELQVNHLFKYSRGDTSFAKSPYH